MKGIILAGGTGSRLSPLTKVTNKHLLPIYDRPMIYFAIEKLKQMGITHMLIVSGKGHAGHFLELLGGGSEFGVNLSYDVQEEAGGIAQALSLAEDFANGSDVLVMLADNVFEDDLSHAVRNFDGGAHIFLKEVDEPQHYGVPRFENDEIVEIVEKPKDPISPYAVTGCYLYSADVFEVVRHLKPSDRGELEITDVNDHYVKDGRMNYTNLEGFWGDCGESIDGMVRVSRYVQEHKEDFKYE